MLLRSLELCPGFAPASNNLGLVFVAEGRWEDAERLCQTGEVHGDNSILRCDLDGMASMPLEGVSPLTRIVAEERLKPGKGMVQDAMHLVLVRHLYPARDDWEVYGLPLRVRATWSYG